jgi:hypothetical protein
MASDLFPLIKTFNLIYNDPILPLDHHGQKAKTKVDIQTTKKGENCSKDNASFFQNNAINSNKIAKQ